MIRPVAVAAMLVLVPFAVASGGASAEEATRTVSGSLTYLPRIALPPGGTLVVEVRAADGDAVLAEWREAVGDRQVPLDFEVLFPAGTAGALRGGVLVGGRALWLSVALPVPDGDGDLGLGTIVMGPSGGAGRPGAAAAPGAAGGEGAGGDIALRCGGMPVTAAVEGERATLAIGGEAIALLQVEAASGARYEAEGDPQTFLWSRGNTALVSLTGDLLPECIAVLPDPERSVRERYRCGATDVAIELRGDALTVALRGETIAMRPAISASGARYVAEDDEGTFIWFHGGGARAGLRGEDLPECRRIDGETAVNGSEHTEAAADGAALGGAEWVVTSIAGEPLPEDAGITLAYLPEGRIAGSAGCNRYMGGVAIAGETLEVGAVATTMMACPEPAMVRERRFLDVLAAVRRFVVGPDGGLILVAADGTEIVARRADRR